MLSGINGAEEVTPDPSTEMRKKQSVRIGVSSCVFGTTDTRHYDKWARPGEEQASDSAGVPLPPRGRNLEALRQQPEETAERR